MKKRLSFINNQSGFFLPYVLFITSLVFIFITSNISIYQNELQITDRQVEQLKIETLFQMGRAKLKENIEMFEAGNTATYLFQDGSVEILIEDWDDNKYKLFFTILTKGNQYKYYFRNILQLDE